MKKQLLPMVLLVSLAFGCKKDKNQTLDTTLKSVKYTFSPGSAGSTGGAQVYYKSDNTPSNGSNISSVSAFTDQVAVGHTVHLQISKAKNETLVGNMRITITFNTKTIAQNTDVKIDAIGTRYIILDKTFAKGDFQ